MVQGAVGDCQQETLLSLLALFIFVVSSLNLLLPQPAPTCLVQLPGPHVKSCCLALAVWRLETARPAGGQWRAPAGPQQSQLVECQCGHM